MDGIILQRVRSVIKDNYKFKDIHNYITKLNGELQLFRKSCYINSYFIQ